MSVGVSTFLHVVGYSLGVSRATHDARDFRNSFAHVASLPPKPQTHSVQCISWLAVTIEAHHLVVLAAHVAPFLLAPKTLEESDLC